MITHGHFHHVYPHRPLIVASLYHKSLQYPCSLEFVIDTGADRTYIVPDDCNRLGISSNALIQAPGPIHTFVGLVDFYYMPNCSLIFTDHDQNSYIIEDMPIFFPPPRRSIPFRWFGKDVLLGEGKFPSVLGRDALEGLSMAFCKTSKYLFLTSRCDDYRQALEDAFGPPVNPNDMDPFYPFQ